MVVKTLPPEDGFLGLESDTPGSVDHPQAVVIPFGLERTVSYGSGTAKGPAAIIKASHQVELFDDEFWCEPCRYFHLATLRESKIPDTIDSALELLANETNTILNSGAFPLVLGGEHTITPGAIRPFLKKWPDLAVLHFDAHADLRDSYEGLHFSHATPIRRCMDHGQLEVVSIGIRSISAQEIPFFEANRHRLHIHWAKDKMTWDIDKILTPLLNRPVYLTFDLDGFDSSLMPATGTPEPGGLFWDETLAILRRAFAKLNIVGADITELAPIAGLHACDFLAAKLAYKILAYKFLSKARK